MLPLSFVLMKKNNISIKSYVKKQEGVQFVGAISAISLICI